MREANIQNEIRIALSKHGIVFRTNSGQFWQGQRMTLREAMTILPPNQPVLINLRRVDGLPAGFSDLLFVGEKQITFVETKNESGRLRPDQVNFLERMRALGHRAGVARDVDSALELIKGDRDG